MLREQGDKISAEDRSNIEAALSNLREAAKGDDGQAVRKAIENLQASSHKVAEAMYQAAAQQQAPTGTGQQPGAEPPKGDEQDKGDDDVIDAEYEVKE